MQLHYVHMNKYETTIDHVLHFKRLVPRSVEKMVTHKVLSATVEWRANCCCAIFLIMSFFRRTLVEQVGACELSACILCDAYKLKNLQIIEQITQKRAVCLELMAHLQKNWSDFICDIA